MRCDCAKLPRRHAHDPRSCTGHGNLVRLVDEQAARIAALEHEILGVARLMVELTTFVRQRDFADGVVVDTMLRRAFDEINRGRR